LNEIETIINIQGKYIADDITILRIEDGY